jgi:transcriptional regulator with XRE-family HTH domain
MKEKGKNTRERFQSRSVHRNETAQERVERLYAAKGGPLIGWLMDEAHARGMQLNELAEALGVTYSYINQLRTGIRSTAAIGQGFAEACGRFLGVPPVVVKLLGGRILLSDFVTPDEAEADLVERAFRSMLADPVARKCLPADVGNLDPVARRALVLMYAESAGQAVFQLDALPTVLRFLHSAAQVHQDNELKQVNAA